MDITQARKRGKKEPEYVLQQPLKDIPIDFLRKNRSIKIPGTSKVMPSFNYDDPYVCLWIKDKMNHLKKKDPLLTYDKFLQIIADKIECFDHENELFIDDEELLIENGKICILPPDWEKKVKEDYKKGKFFWKEKLKKMDSIEIDKLIEIKRALMKENKNLSSKKALDIARQQVLVRRKRIST